ncbi:DUF429 domain-containing protein [Trujillonella endophytica]|uniref:DUF429 domain-containing protein n=1 Tax=Trujillonella endophytica TaxID=673521 RepID=A0A1H8R3B7_9ACTN|nr:DUF429 domain-containing protein [Trujillella endophytica]SEO60668.1 Protein of unknown function [Trujillella endophytica]
MAVLGVDGCRGRWAGALLEGRSVRLLLLDDVPAVLAVPGVRVERIRALEPAMDVLDACAAAWSARRIADGTAECVGEDSPDSRGRPMRVHW